jgi:hemolysin-activating ACP:hemolysin acyltransferase
MALTCSGLLKSWRSVLLADLVLPVLQRGPCPLFCGGKSVPFCLWGVTNLNMLSEMAASGTLKDNVHPYDVCMSPACHMPIPIDYTV